MTLDELLKHNAEVRARREAEDKKKKELEEKKQKATKKTSTKKNKITPPIAEGVLIEEQEPVRKFLVSAEEEAVINNK